MELLEAFLLFIFAVIISSIIYNRFPKILLLLFKSHWCLLICATYSNAL